MVAAFVELDFPAFDPVLIDLPGPVDIRWYGLAYVLGFVFGYRILMRLARRGFLPLDQEGVGDLLVWLVLGVMLGGRLGYALFYDPGLFSPPWRLLEFWGGGMSFHGGLLGVFIALMWFAKKRRIPAWRLGDALALAVPPGLFFGRIANFINGELFGRVTDASVPWAMRFPTDPKGSALLGLQGLAKRAQELRLLEAVRDGTWARIKAQVPLRHPSQIYQALTEGLLLGLCLWFAFRGEAKRPRGAGFYGGLFLVLYGCFRFVIEFYRQPDPQLGFVLGPFTRGQELCALMVVAGALLMALRRRAPAPPPAAERTG